ncbi:2-isopropylmalate synthase, partial [Pseudomonas amygdali pv. mori str. 301020]
KLQEENGNSAVDAEVHVDGETQHWRGKGKGALEALVAGLPVAVEIMDYNEHAIGSGTTAQGRCLHRTAREWRACRAWRGY